MRGGGASLVGFAREGQNEYQCESICEVCIVSVLRGVWKLNLML